MDIKLQGRLTDYITDKLSAKYPEIIPDDLRTMIYKILKKNMNKLNDPEKLQSIVEENTLIANVKERYYPIVIQPFGVARQIVRRLRNDCI